MSFLEEKLKNIPEKPGVYLMKDEKDKIIYVGKAKSLKSRVNSYFKTNKYDSAKTRILVKKIQDLEYILTDTESEALILENNLIKKHKPRYNIDLKDDKTYPFIKITKEEYPRLMVTRNIIKDGSQYYGPYTSAGALNETVELLKRLFPFRTCNNTTFRSKKPCLNYHIKKCYAPCVEKISQEEYKEIIQNIESFLKGHKNEVEKNLVKDMEKAAESLDFEKAARIRDKISAVRHVIEKQKIVSGREEDQDVIGIYHQGKQVVFQVFFIRNGRLTGRDNFHLSSVIEESQEKILEEFLKNYYINKPKPPREVLIPFPIEDTELIEATLAREVNYKVRLYVPVRGKNKELVNMVMENAKNYMVNVVIRKEETEKIALKELKDKLRLKEIPQRIECFDISNISGTDNVASMVVFSGGNPDKRSYRKFKIKSFVGADDFRSMNEVLGRRLEEGLKGNEKFLPFPDLIIIDGGKGQLSSALRALADKGLENKIAIVSLAEKEELIFLPKESQPVILDRRGPGLHLVQRIRNEAHRFAITFHRSLRTKRNLESILDDIPGVGEKRKKILLKKYGSLYNIVKADLAELYEVPGIPKNILENVYNYLKSHEDLQMRMKRKEGRND